MKAHWRTVGGFAETPLGPAYAAIALARHSRCTGYLESALVAVTDGRIDRRGRWRSPELPVGVEAVVKYVNWAATIVETGNGCWVAMGMSGGCLLGIYYRWCNERPSQRASDFLVQNTGP